MRSWLLALAAGAALGALLPLQEADEYRDARLLMVRQQIASRLGGRNSVTDTAVLRAMETVPRHRFARPGDVDRAYSDRPLPIGHGQTISQPYIVAAMTEMMHVVRGDVVLEIGTGSGYQAAVLAEITDSVYTIEVVEPLGQAAARRLAELGYGTVRTLVGDGYFGWPDHPPFDGILVTAAASHIPPPLVEQLKPGARMVIPVGAPFQVQSLMLVEKQRDGSVIQWNMGAVRFVPLTRGD
ncbi:protein-L-isoaspartate(D-aspartate) O-methyltransferase [Gemmatimonadota bacterium]